MPVHRELPLAWPQILVALPLLANFSNKNMLLLKIAWFYFIYPCRHTHVELGNDCSIMLTIILIKIHLNAAFKISDPPYGS